MSSARTVSTTDLVALEIAWRDPLQAFEAVADRRWPVLLDSAGPVGPRSRWCFVACDPFTTLVAADGELLQDGRPTRDRDPFEALRRLLAEYAMTADPRDLCDGVRPPFHGGAIGFVAYDAAHWLEEIPAPRDPRSAAPDFAYGLYGVVAAFDRARERAWIIANGRPADRPEVALALAGRRAKALARRLDAGAAAGPESAESVPESAAAHLETVSGGLESRAVRGREGDGLAEPLGSPERPERPERPELPELPELPERPERPEVEAAIRRVVDYVHAGDIFQANLSQAFGVELSTDDTLAGLYLKARAATPAPFGACLRVAGVDIVSVSPERFLRSDGDALETCPIKGTRPRRPDPSADEAEAAALLASEKDRAENVMIVDLMRSDLSRVCRDGSVAVESLCALERHPTVHHLVSTITGRLSPGMGPIDALRATFPAGSITGAPKVRAMEIIAELEGQRRGVYCGAIGYFGFDGVMDSSVAIRTIVIRDGRAVVRAGGGIVADSLPASEYEEMLLKARAPLFALGVGPEVAQVAQVAEGAEPAGLQLADANAARPVALPLAAAPTDPPIDANTANRSNGRSSPIRGIGADGHAIRNVGAGDAEADTGAEADARVDSAARRPSERGRYAEGRVLILDNYDSFVYTIARYVGELGAARTVVRNDALGLDDIAVLAPTHIIISPGPRTPQDAGISIEVIRRFGPTIPILGICLGHQAIAAAYGGRVERGDWPMHGRRSQITHDGRGVFRTFPSPMGVGRYHSLVVDPAELPAELEVTAWDHAGVIMALRHREHPVVGVQFHPESIMTDHGHRLLAGFLDMKVVSTVAAHSVVSW